MLYEISNRLYSIRNDPGRPAGNRPKGSARLTLAADRTRFDGRADSADPLLPARAPRARARRTQPRQMALEHRLELKVEPLDLGLLGEFRPLLPVVDSAAAAAVKLLQAQLGFSQGGLIFVIEPAERFVHFGHRAKPVAQHPPFQQCERHRPEHQGRERAEDVRAAAPPREPAQVVPGLPHLRRQVLDLGTAQTQLRLALLGAILSRLLIE